jgi:SAM-dependent methyltransferase
MEHVAAADCTFHKLYDSRLPPEINWLECLDCRHVFTEGWFGDDATEILFAKAHANQLPGHEVERGRAVSARIVDRIKAHAPAGSKWLDVGFGDGSLLAAAEEYGFSPLGIDLRQDAVDRLNELGIKAVRGDLISLALDKNAERFGVVSMADVLEHIPFPGVALYAAHRLLRPDGCIFVSCPNMGSLAWDQLTRANANPYWGEIEHYHNLTRVRLTALLRQYGFEVVDFTVSERYRLGMELIAVKGAA